MIGLLVLGTGIACLINDRIISEDASVLASTATCLLPVVAVILDGLFPDEATRIQFAVGVAVVLAGVALVRRKPAPKSEPAPKRVRVALDTD